MSADAVVPSSREQGSPTDDNSNALTSSAPNLAKDTDPEPRLHSNGSHEPDNRHLSSSITSGSSRRDSNIDRNGHDRHHSSDSRERSRHSSRHYRSSRSPAPSRSRSRSPSDHGDYSDKDSRSNHRSSHKNRNSRDRYSTRHSSSRRERERERERDRDRDRDRRRDRERDRGRDRDRRSRRGRGRDRERSQSPIDSVERDRRTVFVQQLAARLKRSELVEFFERAGPVRDASIVKDKVSGRSKGVAYVEFKSAESVAKAISLTGEKVLGIPVIVQFTEAEKNRQARIQMEAQGMMANNNSENAESSGNGDVPYENGENGRLYSENMTANESSGNNGIQRNQGPAECRIYVGNINFNLSENDLVPLFQGFGPIQYIQLQREPTGKSKGYAFVQYLNKESADKARESMQGFPLLGRALRVGMGGDRSQVLPNVNKGPFVNSGLGPQQAFQGSAFSTTAPSVDKVGGEVTSMAHASSLDDADVAGISFAKVSRDNLMKKLMREDDNLVPQDNSSSASPAPQNSASPAISSRYILIQNMFNAAEETGDDWVQELEDDVKDECEEKYGKVVHIAVDPSSGGEVYIKFADLEGAERAIKGLNGRFFAGRELSAQPFIEMMYALK